MSRTIDFAAGAPPPRRVDALRHWVMIASALAAALGALALLYVLARPLVRTLHAHRCEQLASRGAPPFRR